MPTPSSFSLKFLREEQHLMLPTVTTIKLTQSLYDALFQYVLTPEQEVLLKQFIGMLEDHIKSKDRSPFSVPIKDLEFLDEGLEELRLLNWIEIPVAVFELTIEDATTINFEEQNQYIADLLERLTIFSRPADSNLIWIYPYIMVR